MLHKSGFSWDWGSVPEWFGGLSLVLAYAIFFRDRRERDRSQINLIGVWGQASWDDQGAITHGIVIRNSSVLPVQVRKVKYHVHVTWLYRTAPGVEEGVKGTPLEVTPEFVPRAVLPNSDWPKEASWNPLKPKEAIRIAGVTCEIKWLQLTDNAGRAWLLRPGGEPVREHAWRGIWKSWS